MQKDVNNLKNEALAQIMEADSLDELEEIRIAYLGRNGKITQIIKSLKDLPESEKKATGVIINQSKNSLIDAINSKKNHLKDSTRRWFDASIPGKKLNTGSTHIITQAINEISVIFERIGFIRRRYPEVEWDWYSFEALNFPENHPARDEWETFFIDTKSDPKFGSMLLTPHTSSGQIREMENVKPPIRMINIAKCYRRQLDISHYPMFHQFEGLVIDKDINITHLKGTLDYFAKSFYGQGVKSRIRPYHFQFTEPSFEVDFSCTVCLGKGCKLCGQGWLEIGGAGVVHPDVLKAGGVDPKKYTGFAFGWGVERALMMKPGLNIDDLRTLYSTKLEVLKQF